MFARAPLAQDSDPRLPRASPTRPESESPSESRSRLPHEPDLRALPGGPGSAAARPPPLAT